MTIDTVPQLDNRLSIIIDEIEGRLHTFCNIRFRQIIYGGDFGGDLAIQLMDGIYGKENYRIYAVILPCYPNQLKDYIYYRLSDRKNVEFIDCGTKCVPSVKEKVVINGACSKIIEIIRDKEPFSSIEICGCFHPPRTLQSFFNYQKKQVVNKDYKFDTWWSMRTFKSGAIKYYLYLFAEFNPRICEFLSLKMDPTDKYWQWWRIHVCKTAIYKDVVMENVQEIWKNYGHDHMVRNILKLGGHINGWRN